MKKKNTQGKKKGGQPPLPKPSSPSELKARRHHRKAATRGQNPLTQDRVTVHRTDWLFISNCEPKAEMRRLRSGQMWNVKCLSSTTPEASAPPKISTCWDSDYQRMTEHMRDGVRGELRNEKRVTWEAEGGNSWYKKGRKCIDEKGRVRKYSARN